MVAYFLAFVGKLEFWFESAANTTEIERARIGSSGEGCGRKLEAPSSVVPTCPL